MSDSRPSRSADRKVAQLAAKQIGVFSLAQLEALGAGEGMIRHRLRSGRWERVFRGVFRITGSHQPGSRHEWEQLLMAACLAVEGAVLSHRAAGRTWGFVEESQVVEITVPRGRRVRIAGIVAHESLDLGRSDRTRIGPIPITTPARTLLDLGSVLPADDLEEALHIAVSRGLVDLRRLERKLMELAGPGRRGAGSLRKLLKVCAVGGTPASVLETRFLRLTSGARLPTPDCQYRIHDPRGTLVAIVDFAYPGARLAIEVDSFRYHGSRKDWNRDLARRNALTRLGWTMVHVTFEDLQRGAPEVLAVIGSSTATEVLRHKSVS
ncbi:MAG: type IV toxin-antitoxin system AbiEi family antitoxin domain-containing protein [Actinomycetota bacterium]